MLTTFEIPDYLAERLEGLAELLGAAGETVDQLLAAAISTGLDTIENDLSGGQSRLVWDLDVR